MAPTSSRWPIWPAIDHARPCKCHGTMVHVTAAAVQLWVSVDTTHCQSTTGWHLATGVVERAQLNDCHELLLTFLVEPARFGRRSRRGTFETIMERPKTDPVPLGASHIPSHIRPRRCGGLCFKRPCASRRDTPHERARARDEHHNLAMSAAHTFHARDGARDRG